MLENAFIGKAKQPTAKELAAELGSSTELWNELVAGITKECGITEQEWNSPYPKYGWSLRLKRKKRNIIYLGPSHGCFRVSMVLGDKAMAVARNLDLPKAVKKTVKEAPHYPEGNAIRIEIKSATDLEPIKKLAKVKVEN
jgi:uncharacterized protein DUF3788